MSRTLKNGGPAFPQPLVYTSTGSGIVSADEVDAGGMTLRDYFAAKAMQGIFSMIATGAHGTTASDIEGGIAREAYMLADAMLKAREA